MNMTKLLSSVAALLILVPALVTTTASQTSSLHGDEQINALLQAMREAQTPSRNIIVEWENETGPGMRRIATETVVRAFPGVKEIRTKRKYTAFLSGDRRRLEYLQESYKTAESKVPYDIRRVTHIFDGTKSVAFSDPLKSEVPNPPRATRSDSDFSGLVGSVVFSCTLPLYDPKLLQERFKLALAESDLPGHYVLDAIELDGNRYRYTIDGERGYNIVKTECFAADNRKDWESNVELKQYGDGTWYPANRERVRYSRKDGKPLMDRRDNFTRAEFNIDIPDETFRLDSLEFPVGTEVFDSFLNESFVIGGTPKRTLIEETLAAIPIVKEEGGRPTVGVVNDPTPNQVNVESVTGVSGTTTGKPALSPGFLAALLLASLAGAGCLFVWKASKH
jgi:hypothetical protein